MRSWDGTTREMADPIAVAGSRVYTVRLYMTDGDTRMLVATRMNCTPRIAGTVARDFLQGHKLADDPNALAVISDADGAIVFEWTPAQLAEAGAAINGNAHPDAVDLAKHS